MEISVADAKKIREQVGATHIVIFAVDEEGAQVVATHGKTERNSREAAQAGNNLKVALGWPEDSCKANPIARECKNCVYFKPDYGIWCFNGWSRDGSTGECLVEPSTSRVGAEHGCRHFEPK